MDINQTIVSHLKRKYKSPNTWPQEVRAYRGADRGWAIAADNWKKQLISRFYGSSDYTEKDLESLVLLKIKGS